MSASICNPLPRWRGFNLLEFFSPRYEGVLQEDDLRWISDWGFDFVRLPMSYRLWTEMPDVYGIREEVLDRIDRVVELSKQYGLHLSLNFHRAPGYCVNNDSDEPFDLWTDQDALDAFCFHWEMMARRYKGIASDRLSFDLVNEPLRPTDDGRMSQDDHDRVIRAATDAIRQIDPGRLVIADGTSWGNDPIPTIADLGLPQSCRGYLPMEISHHQAHWVASERFPAPAWPTSDPDDRWDRERLEGHYNEWSALFDQGVGVHCGECGCFSRTPHDIFLAWFEDVLDILTELDIGYALWNFRGSFGILDSDREDVAYENWHGHALDRKLLDLLLAH